MQKNTLFILKGSLLELRMYANAHSVLADAGQVGVGEATDLVDLQNFENVFYTER